MNLYLVIDKVKREINRRLEEISVETHPVDFAWLLYALQYEKDTSLFLENFNKLKRWVQSDISGKNDRDIGALTIYVFLERKTNTINKRIAIDKIKKILKMNIEKSMFKYSIINNPNIMFLLSLISEYLDNDIKIKTSETIIKNLKGLLVRKILFSAALINLGKNVSEIHTIINEILSTTLERIDDRITLIWFFKKYRIPLLTERIYDMWNDIIKELPTVEDENNRILLSTQILSLLYEALNLQLHFPEPFFVFSLYPLEKELREACEDYIKNKKYSTAISEALKKLLDLMKKEAIKIGEEDIKREIGKLETKDRELIRFLLNPRLPQNFKKRESKEIPLKFSKDVNNPPGKNIQEGLALMMEGLWVAFRHPEAHYPIDHEARKLDPYEAISILITIDYLWKQIKKVCSG